MSLAIVYSRAPHGIKTSLITIEVHLSNGMAAFNIVGLAEAAVKESRDRVRSALLNANFEFPYRRITVNLAPADLPKEGGGFDLPIAIGILAATQQIPSEQLADYEFTGELALSGELRAVRGALPMALGAMESGRQFILPKQNAKEAGLIGHANVRPAEHLLQVCAHLRGEEFLPLCQPQTLQAQSDHLLNMADVRGQSYAKRALEVAAAGSHSLLFIGPPGTGKTMLASRLPSILPPLNNEQALEVAAIASISNSGFDAKNWKAISFRAPHHSSSGVALVGGGRPPKPGEISLAHKGVLFLDELPEFNRSVLECLREPLESGAITISRAAFQSVFPAEFQFIAAMNPCPCGYAGSAIDQCRCNPEQVKRYMSKISGPLLDRIDMQVEVARLSPQLLAEQKPNVMEDSDTIRQRVILARERQMQRQGKANAALSVAELDKYINIEKSAQDVLTQVMVKFNLSARVYHRLLKLALTMADMAGFEQINQSHISEALGYRCLDKMPRLAG